MYRKFYGLTRNPFELSPDPFFFYATERHNEALAVLAHGVLGQKGFAVVTGEVGTGKTLLVRCLLDALTRKQVAFAYVYNPMLSVPDFLAHLLNDLGLPSATRTKGESLSQLNNYLLVRSRRGATTALIVDEAQLLSWELLEEIRLLTNLETSRHKLLQIVLVGQPELDRRLDSQELRQLKQRIGLRCHLEPLGLEQVRGYIYRRLEVAGANSHRTIIFPEHTIEAIYKFSCGIPRLVNTLCENSLVAGYGRQVGTITPEIVQEVAEDFRLNLVTETSAPGSNMLEERKKVLMTLFRMIEEAGGSPKRSFDETKLESGAKAQ
jgi:type II secretory pathway predicted ATPase ExeA